MPGYGRLHLMPIYGVVISGWDVAVAVDSVVGVCAIVLAEAINILEWDGDEAASAPAWDAAVLSV